MKWEMVIGLEVHIQLQTQSKLFSSASTAYGAKANSQASWLDFGMPGTLPRLNRQAVDFAIMFGIATNSTISRDSFFARKNYFYPDLPKGYQISQSDNPIVQNGYLDIEVDGIKKRIRIERAHLEEDAGKSIHEDNGTALDYNRAGTALLEIVTHPDFRSSAEVIAYLKKLHQLVQHLGICDGNMQEGSFRCDVNLSIRPADQEAFGTRAELKNINSFRFIDKAIQYEFNRQVSCLEKGEIIIQETRLYDPDKNETRSMRKKEDAYDYRYFPDPDLLPIIITQNHFDKIKSTMPMMPEQRQAIYAEKLSNDEANFLLSRLDIADYFDQVSQSVDYKSAYSWVTVDLLSIFNRDNKDFDPQALPTKVLVEIIEEVQKDNISNKSAKQVMQAYIQAPADVGKIIDTLGVRQVSDSGFVEAIAQQVIANNPEQTADYRDGKTKLMSFFVGQVMKQSKGKANPKQVNEVLIKLLDQA